MKKFIFKALLCVTFLPLFTGCSTLRTQNKDMQTNSYQSYTLGETTVKPVSKKTVDTSTRKAIKLIIHQPKRQNTFTSKKAFNPKGESYYKNLQTDYITSYEALNAQLKLAKSDNEKHLIYGQLHSLNLKFLEDFQ